ncbi:conjugative transposon protein TraM [Mucilaginibacter sp. 21P]|uniref:conjugative transposon protein TraM n=1 Tax=Mucilaginibacter sp. 21P TaxID=2778902 RepID=UPI001C569D21|nr:conjugative transposon protein TraM [Mucilaginibacter sp. 21P]QXV66807.1 conjugative transposon protein TraM [Mucilaginibacter sp. 21P]
MEKQRKFYLVLPLLVVPFLTMAFWALGGGKDSGQRAVVAKGLDTNLPAAQFNDKNKTDKMAIYQAAGRDSSQDGISPAFLKQMGLDKNTVTLTDSGASADDQATKLQSKLAALNRQINQPEVKSEQEDDDEPEPAQVKHLKKMMRKLDRESVGGNDPEMKQLDQMLDKIQAMQNPSPAKAALPKTNSEKPFRAIPAVIDGKQKIANGAAVKMKLTDSMRIKGQLLPQGQIVFGSAQIANQRLFITIRNIRLDTQIIPVDMTVFSEDGMPGIPAPEAVLNGVATENADQTLQSMQIMSMDQSLAAQAAAGGINAAKDLFSKKVKKIKVKLTDKYPVLIKINR